MNSYWQEGAMIEKENSLIGWFTRNPVAANLLMAFFIFAGVVTATGIRQEFLPDMKLNLVRITILFPGASPEEVEKQVCRKVEAALAGTKGVKKLYSTAAEGAAVISAEILFRADISEVRENIRQRVDGIATLPGKAERPVIQVVTVDEGVLWLIISGKMDERSLKAISRQVHTELQNLPEISKANLEGVRDEVITIEVDDQALLRYNLTISEIAEAVRNSSLDAPLGTIKSSGGEILLRAENLAATGLEYENIVVTTSPDGAVVRLNDITRIKDGFEETDWFLRYQGEKAAGIQVFRVGGQSIREVASAVHRYIGNRQQALPEGVHLAVIADTSVPLKDQISMMVENVATGGLLVYIALTLFLRMRLAFWVVAGMPVSFLGAIWLMNFSYFDLSINMLTLFGFILVIGVVVDDAIVIGESIHSVSSKKGYGVSSAIAGAKRVALPATFGVLTTVAAFTPILMLPGVNGQLWSNIAWVVIFCLLFSLVESKLILPAHLAHMGPVKKTWCNGWLLHLQHRIDNGLEWFISRIYRSSLHRALRWRYSVLALFLGIALITWGMVDGGRIRLVFFPDLESDTLQVELAMPGGTPFATTSVNGARIEQAALLVNEKIRQEYGIEEDVIRHLISFSGSETEVWFYAELLPAEKRPLSSKKVAGIWRQTVGAIPGATRLVFNGSEDDAGPALDIQLSGAASETLRKAADEVKQYLAGLPGVLDVRDSLVRGKQEMKVSLLPGVEPLGIRLADLSNQLHHSFHGEKVQTLMRNGEEVDVYVRYSSAQRNSIGDLSAIHLLAGESRVRFDDIAETTLTSGTKEISRVDRKRIVSVTGDVDSQQLELGAVIDELQNSVMPEITRKYPGVRYSFAGQQEGKNESMQALLKGSLYAFFLIFALMAIPLGSYFQPLLIMAAIPFGIVGSLWGHWLLGLPVSVLSLCGILALAGVVVNDSLVMVDFVNKGKKTTGSAVRAVCKAGPARFRAIMLTSLTTFVGLVPMMTEKSLQAQFLIPMAVSLAFGILFATVITLYLIPALYLVGYDLVFLFRGFSRRQLPDRQEVFK